MSKGSKGSQEPQEPEGKENGLQISSCSALLCSP